MLTHVRMNHQKLKINKNLNYSNFHSETKNVTQSLFTRLSTFDKLVKNYYQNQKKKCFNIILFHIKNSNS